MEIYIYTLLTFFFQNTEGKKSRYLPRNKKKSQAGEERTSHEQYILPYIPTQHGRHHEQRENTCERPFHTINDINNQVGYTCTKTKKRCLARTNINSNSAALKKKCHANADTLLIHYTVTVLITTKTVTIDTNISILETVLMRLDVTGLNLFRPGLYSNHY